jgi:hypothetical protein
MTIAFSVIPAKAGNHSDYIGRGLKSPCNLRISPLASAQVFGHPGKKAKEPDIASINVA